MSRLLEIKGVMKETIESCHDCPLCTVDGSEWVMCIAGGSPTDKIAYYSYNRVADDCPLPNAETKV